MDRHGIFSVSLRLSCVILLIKGKLSEYGLAYLHLMDGLGFGFHNKCQPVRERSTLYYHNDILMTIYAKAYPIE